tara:strand:+ start:8134 stop:9660 length:1527 start_codon:yes stop_codon:yes gene_type:complete
MQNDDDVSQQNCSKWVNSDNFNLPCNPENGNPGDPPGQNDNCQKLECPAHCQYPYTKNVYSDGVIQEDYYDTINQKFPSYNYLNENPEDLNNYVTLASDRANLRANIVTYNNQNVPQDLDLKCGPLLTPSEENDTYQFPEMPSEEVLRQTIQYNIEYLNRGIDWGKIKRTDKLNSEYESQINEVDGTVVINDFTIELADNGIELEWWDRQPLSQEQLKAPLPVNIREYQTLENIHEITGNVLSMVFPDHTIQNMVIEEVYDWLMKNNLERNTQSSETTDSLKFTMADFFGITTDQVTNRDFEICINQLMMTEHDDDDHLRRINSFENLTDLGNPNNRKDLLYVEAKILKFLILDPSKVGDCLDIVYLTDEVCNIGLTSNSTQMMGKFLKMNTDNVDDDNYDDNMRVLTKRLLKHLPNIIKKVIEIAEYYEKQKCNGELHKNTKLLKEIYNNLFLKMNMKIDLPSLNFGGFFRDFEQNIFTKIILLFFIAYIVSHFIKLFNINLGLPSK